MNRHEHLRAHFAALSDEQLMNAVAHLYVGLYDAGDETALARFGERLDRALSRGADRLAA